MNMSFMLDMSDNKNVLDDVCFAAYGKDPRNPFKVDVERHGEDAKTVARYRGSYGTVWRKNPKWVKLFLNYMYSFISSTAVLTERSKRKIFIQTES